MGGIIKKATLEQLDKRESDCILFSVEDTKYQPRRIDLEEGGVHYLDHEGDFWDEICNKKLEREEPIDG